MFRNGQKLRNGKKKKEISTKIKHTHTTTPQYTKRKSVVRNDSTQSNLLVVLTTIRGERYHLYFVFSSLFSFPETNFFLLVNFSFFRIIHPVTASATSVLSLSLSLFSSARIGFRAVRVFGEALLRSCQTREFRRRSVDVFFIIFVVSLSF